MYQSRQLTQVARRRRSGWLWGLALILISLVLGAMVYTGLLFFRNAPAPVSPPISPVEPPTGISLEPVQIAKNGLPEPYPKAPKIQVDTEMVYEYHYGATGKTRREVGAPTREMVGLNEAGLKQVYPQYQIKEFSTSRVILREEVAGMPDPDTLEQERKTYRTIKEKDGVVVVYAGRSHGGLTLLRSTSIKTSVLPKEARDQLAKGLVVKGEEEVARYLEGFDE